MSHTHQHSVALPSGVSARVAGGALEVSGPKGKVERKLGAKGIDVRVNQNEIVLVTESAKDKKMINTAMAHVHNMVKGVQAPYEYRLAIVFSHFPINAVVKKEAVEINNFIGEKKPRIARIVGSTKVEIKGRDIFVAGPDKEAVGQTAANLENACRIRGKDRRVFQDGIYIQ